MFTDWTMTDPHYFYGRGFILGVVLSFWFWGIMIPWISKKLKTTHFKNKKNN